MREFRIDINALYPQRVYLKTEKLEASEFNKAISKYKTGVVIEEDYLYHSYKVRVVDVTNEGDHFLVAFEPFDRIDGDYGVIKLYKDGDHFHSRFNTTVGFELLEEE